MKPVFHTCKSLGGSSKSQNCYDLCNNLNYKFYTIFYFKTFFLKKYAFSGFIDFIKFI